MSKSDKETQDTGQKPEKTMTRYDLKMQRRREQKKKELRDKRIGQVVGIALVVVLACFVVSFPIRSWLTLHSAYITVNGEKITKVEYDYNYNVTVSNYLSQMGYYLYYLFGIDISQDFTSEMYSDTLTWGDYFDQMTVERISQNKGLAQQARAEGFTYDVTEEYDNYVEELKAAAAEEGSTVNAFVKQIYGAYATESRVKPYIEETLYTEAYANVITERMTPAQEEIEEYYNNNTQDYDSVDYYLLRVDAELPTEPTDLADPVEETEDSGDGEDVSDGEEEVYQPSEAEIEAAMKEAKTKAESMEKAIETEGELLTNVRYTGTTNPVRDWLFAEERTAGETAVLEYESANCYYVVKFVGRYLDQTPSADYRMAVTSEGNGQDIYDEWKNGAATEESFAEICDKYNDSSANEGGLVEGRVAADMSDNELKDWLFDSARVAGDTAVITPEGQEYTYILYYIGLNDPEWILDIRDILLNEKIDAYVDDILANADVEDPKGHLRFIKILKEEAEAAQDSGEDTESGEEDLPEDSAG